MARSDPRLSLERQLAGLAPLEAGLDPLEGVRADQQRSRLGGRLQARGRVQDVARRAELDRPGAPERGQHRHPGLDADPYGEPFQPALPAQLAGVGLDRPKDAQAREHSALRVVLVSHRGAEQDQGAVAGDSVDLPAEFLRCADHPCDAVADDLLEILGIESLAQRRRSDYVGEEGGDHFARFARGRLHREGRAAAGAEACVVRIRPTADRTHTRVGHGRSLGRCRSSLGFEGYTNGRRVRFEAGERLLREGPRGGEVLMISAAGSRCV